VGAQKQETFAGTDPIEHQLRLMQPDIELLAAAREEEDSIQNRGREGVDVSSDVDESSWLA
jgi:hypothetical protein